MTEQKILSGMLGFTSPNLGAGMYYSILNDSSNNTRVAFQLFMQESKTLTQVDIYVRNVYGTQANRKCVLYIYDCNADGKPGSLITNGTSNEASNFGTAWLSLTWSSGSRPSLSANTCYWIIIKNTATSSTVDYFSVVNGNCGPYIQSGGITSDPLGYYYYLSNNGGSTWWYGIAGGAAFKSYYDDSTFGGLPLQWGGTYWSPAIYGSNEVGVQFTLPANCNLNVRGARLCCERGGALPSNPVIKLYTGSTPSLVATSNQCPPHIGTAGGPCDVRGYFSSQIQIAGGTIITLTCKLSGSDGDVNNCLALCYMQMKNDSDCIAMIPWGCKLIYYNGSWGTYADYVWSGFGLILDTDGEFCNSSGAGGPIFSRIRSGF